MNAESTNLPGVLQHNSTSESIAMIMNTITCKQPGTAARTDQILSRVLVFVFMVGSASADLAAEDTAGATSKSGVVMTDPASPYHPIELSTTKERNLWNKKMACERAHEAGMNDQGCMGCHAGVSAAKASDGKISKIHNWHYVELKMGFECGTCHKRVDHHNGNGMSMRKQTDPGLCQNCHPTFDKKLFGTEQWRNIARSAAKVFFEKNK